MSLHGAFTALLLLLVSGVSAVIVLPPTNVTVSCQNFRVTASWEYSEPQPQTVFSINISGSPGWKEFNTTDRQYDLSNFIWESEDHYMGKYCINVTAIQGGTRSRPVTSKTFAFNILKTADILGELDFPPVELIKRDSEAIISFTNPFNFYKELELAREKDSGLFTFSVEVSPDEVYNGECNPNQESCVSFPKGVEKCVVLKGLLFASSGVGQVKFRETDPICVTESPEFHMETLVILLSVFVVVLVVVTIFIFKAKAWTMDLPPLPKPLLPKNGAQDYHVEVDPDVYNRIDCTDDSVRTECVSMDEEEEQKEQEEQVEEEQEEEEDIPHERNYDRLHFVQMDIGDGDMVDAYSAR
ncbi:interferon gamma receptor 1 isoform X2 [Dicentrarchus labrax]|uniref:interferon gamma receptor 1 isoform X2 n=1 Tax=Dicentrarchus labrax TaxID=13489 RepID=UPI00163661D5|nr:interferon gamma receptor 1 isoform X2 [Dicentrarchus labrax]